MAAPSFWIQAKPTFCSLFYTAQPIPHRTSASTLKLCPESEHPSCPAPAFHPGLHLHCHVLALMAPTSITVKPKAFNLVQAVLHNGLLAMSLTSRNKTLLWLSSHKPHLSSCCSSKTQSVLQLQGLILPALSASMQVSQIFQEIPRYSRGPLSSSGLWLHIGGPPNLITHSLVSTHTRSSLMMSNSSLCFYRIDRIYVYVLVCCLLLPLACKLCESRVALF